MHTHTRKYTHTHTQNVAGDAASLPRDEESIRGHEAVADEEYGRVHAL